MSLRSFTRLALLASVCSAFLPEPVFAKSDKHHSYSRFEHAIQLQLTDSLGFSVPNAQFWVTLDIVVDGPLVTINFPVINFETVATPYNPFGIPPLVPGGYVYTSDGFLPADIRPNDLVNRSIVAASNNGLSPVFSFTQAPDTLPQPPAGYIVQVTNAGGVVIQCAGTFGNIIPPGPQILMPCSITYKVEPQVKLSKNKRLSTGFTNTTQFTEFYAYHQALRSFQANDAFDGVAAWAWADNSTVADKTNGTLNLMVAVGKVDCKGKLKVRKPIQLTNLEPNTLVWDKAVTINRMNPKNIVVSCEVIDNTASFPTAYCYRAVSYDGGKTWPVNGPAGIPITGTLVGENRGVSSDKYGNIWYNATNFFDSFGNETDQPFFYVSTDGGKTYTLVYEIPLSAITVPTELFQYPQYCFGGDGLGNYGLHFSVGLLNVDTDDWITTVGFIPIYGFNSFGTGTIQIQPLTSLVNSTSGQDITASTDGRVWLQGTPNSGGAFNYIAPVTLLFKSPGALDQNYAGNWHQGFFPNLPSQYGLSTQDSQPAQGYFLSSTVQSIIYDDNRQALYAVLTQPRPDYSQNMVISFIISRNNGQTWSNPIEISTSSFANRGFQSMALDTKTGNLLFGWYDGRHDPTFQSVEYFGAVLPAKQLDKLVKKIPLSNPLYTLPSAATTVGSPIESKKVIKEKKGKAPNKKKKPVVSALSLD